MGIVIDMYTPNPVLYLSLGYKVNDKEYRVNVKGPYTFEIEDTTGFQDYIRGGYVNQVKQPVKMSFKSLRDALVSPGEFVLADFAKMERPGTLHVAFRALHEYANQHGKLPTPGALADAEELLKIAKSLNESAQEGQFRADNLENEKEIILKLALTAVGNLSPMAALFGGIVGQEVLKACSGKFAPIGQYFYFDAVECLPDEPLPYEEIATTNSRYDGQVVVFGKTMQQMLSNLSYFLVGAGAIGCEMLKNWAMMGVGTGEAGAVHVTDMDRIEKSNLSRQFLFRPQDIGSAKSVVACRAAQAMNPALKVVAYENRVGGDTENIFNDDFYESLNGICNALDNIEARLYMDQRCLFYQLPLLESGTLGTKGSTQVVVPHLTENYGATRDPPEKGIPVCTLKNFPNQIEHTVQWARDWFEGVFKQAPDDVNQYLTNPGFIDLLKTQQNTKLETMKRIHECLVSNKPGSYADCIVWARLRFEELFNNMIRQLLHNFPLEQLTKEGQPFWSGPKKPPTPIVFDHKDPLHFDFIKGVAELRAFNYGIAPETSEQFFREVIPSIMVPDFSPVDGVKIAVTEQESKTESSGGIDVDAQFDNMLKSLPSPSSIQGFKMSPIEFDKDFDDQMIVIVAVSNLRARVYKIPEADLHKTRQIAGKIIPAIATTTALVTGLICLELYKLLQKKAVTAYKSASVNLAIPLFTFSEPNPPAVQNPVVKGEEWKWSAWDRIDIEGDLTLKEFLKYIEDQYGLSVSMVSHGVSILYSFFAAKKTVEQRMPMKLSEVVTQVTKKPLQEKKRYLILEIICMDMESSEDVEVPYVRMRIK